MHLFGGLRAVPWWVAGGLGAVLWTGLAQASGPAQEADWRRANEAVGALARGHADVLKWEQQQAPAPGQTAAPQPAQSLPTAEAAVRLAWRMHRELAHPIARLGADNVALVAQGRWTELDPSWQRRVHGMDELLAVARQARQAWLKAVAAQQALPQHAQQLDAAQAAHELGRRMAKVGNWSQLQLTQVALAEASARMNLRRAQLAAAQAQQGLVAALGQVGLAEAFALPPELPALPPQPMAAAQLQALAQALRQQLPHAESRRFPAFFPLVRDTYLAAHAQALDSQDSVLATRALVTEETLLRYNGMLKSVWDLLTESQQQAQAAVQAIEARRNFWLADADLQWMLQGGEPSSLVSLDGAGASSPAAAGH